MTNESAMSRLFWQPAIPMAPWRHAVYPAAKGRSRFFAPTRPHIAIAGSRSSWWISRLERALPQRPPVAVFTKRSSSFDKFYGLPFNTVPDDGPTAPLKNQLAASTL